MAAMFALQEEPDLDATLTEEELLVPSLSQRLNEVSLHEDDYDRSPAQLPF